MKNHTFDSKFSKEVGYDDLSKALKDEYMDIMRLKILMVKLISKNCDKYKDFIEDKISSIDGLKIKKIDTNYLHIVYYKRFLKNIYIKESKKKYIFDFSFFDEYILEFLELVFNDLIEIVEDKTFRDKYSKYITYEYTSLFINTIKSINNNDKSYLIFTI